MTVFDRSLTVRQEPRGSSLAEESAQEAVPAWGPAKRFLFRFVFSYLLLYLLPSYLSLLDFTPGGATLAGSYRSFWQALVPWVGKHLFGVGITVFPNGSGDTTYNYVEVVCLAVVAASAALVWTLLDRRRPNYARLYEFLRVYVRFGLATAMIEYGALKVIPAQFPRPSLDRLLQPFGNASPMGLLWTFMGASPAYTTFAGLTELAGGVLLVFRRTALLGALVCTAALTNVVVLNFCYDVPVKLYSSHLLAMALFLAAPDLRRLANLLVLNRPVAPASERPLFQRRWLHLGALALRTIFVVGFTGYMLNMAYEEHGSYADRAVSSPLHGVWSVDALQTDGPARPLAADEGPWRRVVFDYPGTVAIQLTDDSRQRYLLKRDAARKVLVLTKRDDAAWKSTLSYQQPAPDRLTLEGNFGGRKVRASLHRVDSSKFLLITRGFHWINEHPLNH